MSKKNPQIASENMKMNFSKGWGIILYQALMFFFLIGFSIDGLNIVAPAFSEATGVDYPSVLSMATVAGMIGVVVYIFIARINVKVGARLLSGVCLIGAAGRAVIALGRLRKRNIGAAANGAAGGLGYDSHNVLPPYSCFVSLSLYYHKSFQL